jgi:hypothetical protein
MSTKRDLAENAGDVAAGSTALAAYLSWLPEVAAFLSVSWLLIRIFEWARIRIFGLKPDAGSKG